MGTELRIVDAPDCGNAPRKAIIRDLTEALSRGDARALVPFLRDDAEWNLLGDRRLSGVPAIEAWVASSSPAIELLFETVLTHGRGASVSGTVTDASGARRHFSHVVQFASASKAAKIATVTSYVIEAASSE